MNKSFLVWVCAVVCLAMLSSPALAQDSEIMSMPVSGTFDYVPEILTSLEVNGNTYIGTAEEDVWSGDFDGPAIAHYRAVIWSTGGWEGWGLTEFEGTVLDDMEGTMVIMITIKKHAGPAEWFGEWWILSGTGDLADIQGSGVVWGPGFNPEDPEASPDIFYSGEVVFSAEETS